MMDKPEKKYNKANTHRFAKNKGIENSKLLSKQEIIDGLRTCRLKQEIARSKAQPVRIELLQDCLVTVIEKEDKD